MSDQVFRRRLWRRPSPAGVIAVIALVLACAGSAAAGSIVTGGSDVRRASATPADLRAPAVGTPKVSPEIAHAGATLGRHSQALGSYAIRTVDSSVAGNAFFDATVFCNPGEKVSGGGLLDTGTADVGDAIMNNAPTSNPGGQLGWFGQVINNGSDPENFTVYAICVT